MWDAPGADTWRALALSYMRSIDAVVVVIDPRAVDVLEDLKYWRSQVPCEHPLVGAFRNFVVPLILSSGRQS